jgi:hypothetical protein
MRKYTTTIDTSRGPIEVPAIEVEWDLGDGPETGRFLSLPGWAAFPGLRDDEPIGDDCC